MHWTNDDLIIKYKAVPPLQWIHLLECREWQQYFTAASNIKRFCLCSVHFPRIKFIVPEFLNIALSAITFQKEFLLVQNWINSGLMISISESFSYKLFYKICNNLHLVKLKYLEHKDEHFFKVLTKYKIVS